MIQKNIIRTIYIIPIFILAFTFSTFVINRVQEIKNDSIILENEIRDKQIADEQKQNLEKLAEKENLDQLAQANIVIEETEKKEIVQSCPKPKKEYIDMWLLNVGQNVPLLDKSYIPKNLELLSKDIANRDGICLEKNTKIAFEQMATDAKKENVFIKVTSGFRSYNTQNNILTEAKKTSTDADLFIAKPGYSEHQLGTAMDISGKSISYGGASRAFDNTPESKWLEENAHKYGFVMSYPYEKEKITGYGYEPWHYRYLGPEIAFSIHENNLTITEYLE